MSIDSVAKDEEEKIEIDLSSDTPIITSEGGEGFEPEVTPPRQRAKEESKRTEDALEKIIELFEGLDDAGELLEQTLSMLTTEGFFQRTALLVVCKEEKKAIPILYKNKGNASPEEVIIDSPLSPLLSSRSKVVSCGKNKSSSPFGCGAFALAPLDTRERMPVALYADCGEDNVLDFERRTLFRKAVELLNHILPDMEGSITPPQ